jgi:Putative beta-barrel porin-2, OmpL-like. bbp2
VLNVVSSFYPKKGLAMKKLVIASAVSALFAAPAAFAQSAPAAAAPAAPAVPTLSQVLDASGVTVSGYIDVATTHADRNVEAGSDRVFDAQNNSFALHQFGLTVAKQPKEGFGGLVNFTVGKDAQVIHSYPENVAPFSMFDVTQAYGQYATGPLTVMFGKYTTLAGTEVIASTGNVNFSRSILFGAVPFTHTGLRAVYAATDSLTLTLGVNNGWDQLTNANKAMTGEFGITFTPTKTITLTAVDYNGKESAVVAGGPVATPPAPEGSRNLADFIASWNIIDPLTIGIEYLNVSQKNFTSLVDGSTISAKYDGYAGYITYMFSPKWRLNVRGESFDDKDGFHFNTPAFPSTKYKEGTATLSWLPADAFEMRVEARRDSADNAVFFSTNNTTGTADEKNLTTFAIQGVYKF